MFTSFKRIIRAGWIGFYRNAGLTLAAIFVMAMVIFLITMLFLFNAVSKVLISSIQEKVDMSVYFKEDIPAEDILAVKSDLGKIPEVKDVEYISKEQALQKFMEKHREEPDLMESLTMVGKNPFLASLNIKAWQASQYEQVTNFLKSSSFNNLIEEVDYYQRKPVIDKVFSITSNINEAGILSGIVLGMIAILIAFNTARMAIYNSSKEISTMKLVGASSWFIQGPFLIQGIITGFLAALITLLITFGLCYGLDAKISMIAPQISSFGLFISNLWLLVLIQLFAGIGLGVISSMIAVRKYLKI